MKTIAIHLYGARDPNYIVDLTLSKPDPELGLCRACAKQGPLCSKMAASGGGTVSGVVWEWQRRDSGFSPFPPQDSSIIEAAYTARSISCTVTHGRVDITKKQLQSGSRELA